MEIPIKKRSNDLYRTIFFSVLIPVLGASAGYLYTWKHDSYFDERKDTLERVNAQLRDLYGPLYALANSSERTWNKFRQRYRPGKAFWGTVPSPTDDEVKVWRLWMTEVFMPINLQIESLLLKHSDLLIESEMPEVLLELMAHVEGYKPVMKLWENRQYSAEQSMNLSLNEYPATRLEEYAKTSFLFLKARQMKLLGQSEEGLLESIAASGTAPTIREPSRP